jgi:hypothetical protein
LLAAPPVRARNIGRDIFAGLKNIVGGEIEEYTKLQAQSREQAMQRMLQDAERLGADAGHQRPLWHVHGHARRCRNARVRHSSKTQIMPAALAINIAVWAFILIACVVLGIRAYNKRSEEDFEKRDN